MQNEQEKYAWKFKIFVKHFSLSPPFYNSFQHSHTFKHTFFPFTHTYTHTHFKHRWIENYVQIVDYVQSDSWSWLKWPNVEWIFKLKRILGKLCNEYLNKEQILVDHLTLWLLVALFVVKIPCGIIATKKRYLQPKG